MAMKLLPKSEIVRAKATAKKQEIDEGLKLARRIDNLREVAAQEEQNLARFRERELKRINGEITQQTAIRDGLKGEVGELRREKARGLKEVEQEWAAISQAQDRLQEREESCKEREKSATDQTRKARDVAKRAQGILARANTKDELATGKLLDASKANQEAQKALKVAQKAKADALEFEKGMTKHLTHRDMVASARERDITIKEDRIKGERAELDKEWALLKDRKDAFYREIKRHKK